MESLHAKPGQASHDNYPDFQAQQPQPSYPNSQYAGYNISPPQEAGNGTQINSTSAFSSISTPDNQRSDAREAKNSESPPSAHLSERAISRLEETITRPSAYGSAREINRDILAINNHYLKNEICYAADYVRQTIEKIEHFFYSTQCFYKSSGDEKYKKTFPEHGTIYNFVLAILGDLKPVTIISESVIKLLEKKLNRLVRIDYELYSELITLLYQAIEKKTIKYDADIEKILFFEWCAMNDINKKRLIDHTFKNGSDHLSFYTKFREEVTSRNKDMIYKYLENCFSNLYEIFFKHDDLGCIADILNSHETLCYEKMVFSEQLIDNLFNTCHDRYFELRFEYLFCFLVQLNKMPEIHDIPINLYTKLDYLIESMDPVTLPKNILRTELAKLESKFSFFNNTKTTRFEFFWKTIPFSRKRQLILQINPFSNRREIDLIIQNPHLIYAQTKQVDLSYFCGPNSSISDQEVRRSIDILQQDLLSPIEKMVGKRFLPEILSGRKALYNALFARKHKEKNLDARLLETDKSGSTDAPAICKTLFVKMMNTVQEYNDRNILSQEDRYAYYRTLSESLNLCSDGVLHALQTICHSLDTVKEAEKSQGVSISKIIQEWIRTYILEKVEEQVKNYTARLRDSDRTVGNEVHDIDAFRYRIHKSLGIPVTFLPDPKTDVYAQTVTDRELNTICLPIKTEIDACFCTDDCFQHIATCIQQDASARDALIETLKRHYESFVDDQDAVLEYVFPHACTDEAAPWRLNPYCWIYLLIHSGVLIGENARNQDNP